MKKKTAWRPRSGRRPSTAAKATRKDGLELTDNPRLAAFRILREVERGRTLEDGLAEHGLLLEPRDLNLCAALVYEVSRHRARLDWLMKSRLSTGRASAELTVILRLGLAQLLFFDRLGDHAIAMETVALANQVTPGRQGLVNAILRGLMRERDGDGPWPPQPPVTGRPADDLALTHSYQPWMVKKLLDRLGPAETEELLTAGNQPTPATLRLNPGRGSLSELQAVLPFETHPTALSPWGLTASAFSGRPEDWPGYGEGLFSIQDEASQLSGLLAGVLPAGSSIADPCGGLGGKALHLAALNPASTVTALDKDEAKLARLGQEAVRLGLTNIKTQAHDLLTDELPEATFDLVLVDAPCTGLGVIRRRPDLKWNKTADDVIRLADLQLAMLGRAASAVKPGGRLLYSVCSFTEEEGPGCVRRFLDANPAFQAVGPGGWPDRLRPHLSSDHNLTLYPHRHRTDGFFWAMLEKS